MRLIAAILKMVRLPNLFFIALTQLLFHYCILRPVLADAGLSPRINGWLFVMLVIASVAIAAAGYIINDYFAMKCIHSAILQYCLGENARTWPIFLKQYDQPRSCLVY